MRIRYGARGDVASRAPRCFFCRRDKLGKQEGVFRLVFEGAPIKAGRVEKGAAVARKGHEKDGVPFLSELIRRP